MSDLIKSIFAAAPPEKAEHGRGAAQKQQWRLMFEKAYLALSRSGTTDERIRTESAGDAGAGRNIDRNAKPTSGEIADEADPAIENGTVQGAPMDGKEQGFGSSAFALELADGGFERRIVELLEAGMHPVAARRRYFAAKTSQTMPEPVRLVEHKEVLPEKSLLFLPAAEGLELVIRDPAAGSDLIRRIILKVREILDSRGMRLARVIVNGTEVWTEKTGSARPEDETTAPAPAAASDLINRIY